MNKRLKNEKGITLIALILTVIIMMILAGITFNALVGDDGILESAMRSKEKQNEEQAKEELQFAWAARMSKYYETVAKGQANTIVDYFKSQSTLDELNQMLGSNGQIDKIDYFDNLFHVRFVSSDGVSYTIKIKPSGEIVNADYNKKYTEVWANYFEKNGTASLIYTTSSLGNTYDGNSDWDVYHNWNITLPIYTYKDVPWYYYNETTNPTGYVSKINYLKIENDVFPESTQFMFYQLRNIVSEESDSVGKIQGLNELLTRVNEIGAYMFYYCNSLTSLIIPETITSIEEFAFRNCDKLTSIEIPNSVTSIGNSAFNRCTGLTSITIPNGVTSIGEYAFRSCEKLTSIEIPNSVTSIGKYAFYYCTTLTNITIPNGVTSISDDAFSSCNKLTSIDIPNTVTSIGSEAFDGCRSLTNITIPDSVVSIGDYAFYDCSRLNRNNNSKQCNKYRK